MPAAAAHARHPRAPPFVEPPGYARHRPESTPLYQLVEQHYPAFRDGPVRGHEERGDLGGQSVGRVAGGFFPAIIQAGQHIRLAGQGERQGKGTAGDLYLEVQFAPHRHYRAEARDLYLDLPVAPWEAALGSTVRVPTPAGAVELRVPANSRAGSKLRLKGRGLPANPSGDLYVTLQIALPPADSDSAREAYGAFASALPFDPRAGLGA